MEAWIDLIKTRVNILHTQLCSAYRCHTWYPNKDDISDLIKASTSFQIDNEELIRADQAMKNASTYLQSQAALVAQKVKFRADNWNTTLTEEDVT
jgi:hypothetical protein